MIARAAAGLSGIPSLPAKVTPMSALFVLLALVAGLVSPHAGAVPVPATPVPCSEEDGSAPDQAFPCHWGGGANGLGARYVLTAPSR